MLTRGGKIRTRGLHVQTPRPYPLDHRRSLEGSSKDIPNDKNYAPEISRLGITKGFNRPRCKGEPPPETLVPVPSKFVNYNSVLLTIRHLQIKRQRTAGMDFPIHSLRRSVRVYADVDWDALKDLRCQYSKGSSTSKVEGSINMYQKIMYRFFR